MNSVHITQDYDPGKTSRTLHRYKKRSTKN